MAAKWAITQTNDANIRRYLDEYISSITIGVNKSVGNGVDIVYILRHEIDIWVTNGHVGINKDTFTDRAQDNGEGVDNVTWVTHGFIRHRPDWTQFIDYEIYQESIEEIGQVLLTDFTAIARRASSRSNKILYNRFLAVDYINTWVENPTWDEYCGISDKGERIFQRESAWNPAYKYIWEPSLCADCADYVSQALKAGGFQEDGIWYASYNSLAWIRVGYLINYLESINAGYLVDNKLSLQLGDLGFVYDKDNSIPWRHVVMISGIDPHQYSAHNSDRHTYHYGGDAFNRHYKIESDIKFVYIPIILKDYIDPYPQPIITPHPYPPPIVTPPPYPAP